jgi:hypothetical protein
MYQHILEEDTFDLRLMDLPFQAAVNLLDRTRDLHGIRTLAGGRPDDLQNLILLHWGMVRYQAALRQVGLGYNNYLLFLQDLFDRLLEILYRPDLFELLWLCLAGHLELLRIHLLIEDQPTAHLDSLAIVDWCRNAFLVWADDSRDLQQDHPLRLPPSRSLAFSPGATEEPPAANELPRRLPQPRYCALRNHTHVYLYCLTCGRAGCGMLSCDCQNILEARWTYQSHLTPPELLERISPPGMRSMTLGWDTCAASRHRHRLELQRLVTNARTIALHLHLSELLREDQPLPVWRALAPGRCHTLLLQLLPSLLELLRQATADCHLAQLMHILGYIDADPNADEMDATAYPMD